MKELLDSVRTQIYSRITSPFFGVFLISWLCWNHRYLLILCSDLQLEYKFTLAQQLLYPTTTWLWSRNLLLPLGSSLVFILLYPYPSRWLFAYWHSRQVELKRKRDEIEGATLLTQEESRQVILDSVNSRTHFEETIRRQAQEIEALTAAAEKAVASARSEAQHQLEIAKRKTAEAEKRLNDVLGSDKVARLDADTRQLIEKMLQMVAENGGEADLGKLYAAVNVSGVKQQFLHDRFMETRLVDQDVYNKTVSLTDKGRSHVIKAGYIK